MFVCVLRGNQLELYRSQSSRSSSALAPVLRGGAAPSSPAASSPSAPGGFPPPPASPAPQPASLVGTSSLGAADSPMSPPPMLGTFQRSRSRSSLSNITAGIAERTRSVTSVRRPYRARRGAKGDV